MPKARNANAHATATTEPLPRHEAFRTCFHTAVMLLARDCDHVTTKAVNEFCYLVSRAAATEDDDSVGTLVYFFDRAVRAIDAEGAAQAGVKRPSVRAFRAWLYWAVLLLARDHKYPAQPSALQRLLDLIIAVVTTDDDVAVATLIDLFDRAAAKASA